MSTTQRSESMNAFFDGYVHAKTNLKEFVDQFDNALKKIENENAADFHSFSVTIPCISKSPIEKKFQDLYTNSKFKEVQQQVTGMIDMNPKLYKDGGAVKTYMVKDEIHMADFAKLVMYYVEFCEKDSSTQCSCGLFQMRGILCRHLLSVFRLHEITILSDMYILDRWRKDIRRRYTLIHSSFDAGEQRAYSNRHSELLNICYQMITLVAGTKEHTQDAKAKLFAMIDLYRANQEFSSMTQTGSNVPISAGAQVLLGVLGKYAVHMLCVGKVPPSLRRASRMEKDMRKVKAKAKKAQEKGKRKERHEGDTPILDTKRSLFGDSEMDISFAGHVQAVPGSTPFDPSGTQVRETMVQSQESDVILKCCLMSKTNDVQGRRFGVQDVSWPFWVDAKRTCFDGMLLP
ncbi:protein FAR-RED ELONGATED HYPOCOTYL 3-like [Carya illinoinensis]|uniref:protein FAR-RED ELONGATED HYPOCOTYL 3-like n=1 Tax=Carya illinoinensis TaxID=32201 RepID=UPI001C7203AD|nr:protein FAR-RED ELONGATED HYPOCOTYL 3-like [Carya illinoinensis]